MTLLETYLGITQDSPEEKVLTLLIELGAQFVGAQEGSLLVVDRDANELVFAMTVGRRAGQPLMGERVPLGQGLVGLAAQTHEVQLGAPTFHLHGREARPAEGEPKAEIAAPLLVNDTLIGVLTAVSFQADKRFSSADALLYARLATVAALVIDQRRRLEAIRALSLEREMSGTLREDERLDLEIVALVSRLVKAGPGKKTHIARLLADILAVLED
jgi:GAF domain-containing protein